MALQRSIENTITHKAKRQQAMSKFTRYVLTHQQPLCRDGLPCGRECHLTGTFWLREMAECFLFLRSQLLSGRWDIFLTNLTALTRRAFWPVYTDNQEAGSCRKPHDD
jgi:hypothetical protein